jgi:prepilin signal peptidase PulO-like enzyme (type II secretory pathway)
MCVAIALRVGWHPDLVLYLVVGLALVALGTIDAQHLLLPRRLIYPVTAVALGWCLVTAQVTHQLHRLFVALVAGLLWWGLFGMLRLLNSKWMGGGDVRLVFLLGLVLGWYQPGSVLVAFFSANILGVVVGSLFIARGTTTRQDPLPFGTYLALGAAMGFFIQPFLATRLPIFDF